MKFLRFLLLARDASTQEWIGEFVEVPNIKTIPECSSVTHADNKDKNQATIVWKSPKNRSGQVFFT
jgi:hypothetical protein